MVKSEKFLRIDLKSQKGSTLSEFQKSVSLFNEAYAKSQHMSEFEQMMAKQLADEVNKLNNNQHVSVFERLKEIPKEEAEQKRVAMLEAERQRLKSIQEEQRWKEEERNELRIKRQKVDRLIQKSGVLTGLREIEQRVRRTFPKVALVSIANDEYDFFKNPYFMLAWGNAFTVKNNEITYEQRKRGLFGLVNDGYVDYSYIGVYMKFDFNEELDAHYTMNIEPNHVHDVYIESNLVYSYLQSKIIDKLARAYADPYHRNSWESEDKARAKWEADNPPYKPMQY